MGRVLTGSVGLRVAREASVGVLGGTPKWYAVEFDSIGAYGAVITTVVRRPISQDRGRKKGTVVDLDSSVEFDTDLTIEVFDRFCEGFMFAEYANYEFDFTHQDFVGAALNATATGYAFGAALSTFTTIDPTLPARVAAKMVFGAAGAQSLVYASGYNLSANNGLRAINADVTTASTEITVSGLSVETAPANARVEVCGVRTDDAVLQVLSTTSATLTSVDVGTAGGWGVLGVRRGMFIHVGGVNVSTGVLTNSPTVGVTPVFGYARIVSIGGASNSVLTLDKIDAHFGGIATSDGAETVDVLFGRFARNIATTIDTDDARYMERTYQFEASYPGLGAGGVTEFEYAVGNFANEITFNIPLANKATCTFAFVGTNSDNITASRKTGASTALSPLRTTAINTSTDMPIISTDVVSSVTDICFKSLTFTILNNVSPEKCLGTLGAVFVNAGLFEFNIEGQMAFTNKAIINAIRNNTTVTYHNLFRNGNGAIFVDVPEMTLSGGDREFPVDQTVLVNITAQSFTSSSWGFDVGFSLFPVVPLLAA